MAEAGRKECLICGYSRAVDRCHLLPRFAVSRFMDMKSLASFDEERNIIILCKNHHFLFDHDKFTEEEWDIVLPYFNEVKEELNALLRTVDLIPLEKTSFKIVENNKFKRSFFRWQHKTLNRFERL